MRRCPSCHSQLLSEAKFCTSCGTRLDARDTEEVEAADRDASEGSELEPTQAADPLIRRVIGKNFRIEKLIGVGGMGKVYQATQLSLDKDIALKVLHPQWASDDTQVHRFHREARAASRIEHPNIIQIIEFGQDDDGMLFMAMELLRGRDLSSVLREDFPLDEARLARIVMQICLALSAAHAKGVIHRDLKLGNVVVEDRGGQRDFVKLFDFGIAKLQDRRGRETRILTTSGVVCGTPEYMSPEQIRGQELDPRTDIYSLGIMLYQLATGQLPFSADSPIDIAAKHVTSRALPPRQVRGEVSREIEAIVLCCLEKKREKRFQNALEMHAALAVLAEGGHPRLDTPIEPASVTATVPDLAVEGSLDADGRDSSETTLDIPAAQPALSLDSDLAAATAVAEAADDAADDAADADDSADDEEALAGTVTQFAAAPERDSPLASPAALGPDDEEFTEEVQRRSPVVPEPITLGQAGLPSLRSPGLLVALLVALALVIGALVGVIGWRLTHPRSATGPAQASPDAALLAAAALRPDGATQVAPVSARDAGEARVQARVDAARPALARQPAVTPPVARPRPPRPPADPAPVKAEARRIKKLLRQGDIRHQAGDYEGALAYYEKARKLDSSEPKVHQKLALAFHNLGRFDDACAALEHFLKLRPHPPGEDYYRALVLRNCNPR